MTAKRKTRPKKTAPTAILVPEDSIDAGREARKQVARSSHAQWVSTPDRDPVEILEGQSSTRIQSLVPIRYGRMAASPFAFYRGAAAVMAADLAPTPTTGIIVQACGDAHISNFGGFASPDRELVFGLNDFDETLPAPWEWDVKRMAASAEIAARELGASPRESADIVRAGVAQYRDSMKNFSESSYLDVWYGRIDADRLMNAMSGKNRKTAETELARITSKATRKTSIRALKKLTRSVNGKLQFINNPPLITPLEDIASGTEAQETEDYVLSLVAKYAETLADDRRHLLEHYKYVHMARKVVGVGSVGTRNWVILFMSERRGDPLILQVKEAEDSVLAPFAGASKYDVQGQRVVEGQRLTQAASDLFLGWLRATGIDGLQHDFYLRQLWDWKFSADIGGMDAKRLATYSRACGGALALAHARSGDRVAIASYLGKGEAFIKAIEEFATIYADQNEVDYENFLGEISAGRVIAQAGI